MEKIQGSFPLKSLCMISQSADLRSCVVYDLLNPSSPKDFVDTHPT